MSNRTNKILIGIIILLIGLISLLQRSIGVNYGGITFSAIGLTLLLLYKTKHKIWSLPIGLYMLSIGVIMIMSPFIPSSIMTRLIAAMLFIVPGIIFIVLFYNKSKVPFLIPGSLLSWIGIYIILAGFPFFRHRGFGLFIVCIGLGFYMINIIGKDYTGKFPKYLGIILCAAGVVFMGGLSPSLNLLSRIPIVGSVALIGVSIYIIINAFKKE